MSNQPFCEFGTSPTLPFKAVHGDEICDVYGNRYKYDAGQDAWISKGIITSPNVVTEDLDCIISPDIFDKLRKLEAYTRTDVDLRPFKLNPGTDAYWYYFRSSDKLIRFKAEGEDQLRIEVDKGRLYQILLKSRCPGKRGPKGDQGDQGDAGTSVPPEECFNPSDITDNKLDFAIFTPTPFVDFSGDIELPNNHIPEISVRLYEIAAGPSVAISSQLAYLETSYATMKKYDSVNYSKFSNTRKIYQEISLGVRPQITNICGIPLSTVRSASTVTESEPLVKIEVSPVDPQRITVSFRSDVPTNQQSIDKTLASVRFDPDTNIVCGSIYLPDGTLWNDLYVNQSKGQGVCIKSAQKGPDGFSGDPGECRIRIVNCDIDSTNIRADCPIINVRLDCDSDTIYTLCANIIDSLCARYIILEPNSATLTDSTVLDSTFAAVEATLDECKRISHYQVNIEEDEIDQLVLPHWEPQPGCTKRRNFSRHKFNWIPATAVGRCAEQGKWFSPNNVRNSRFPWDIQAPSRPTEDECCQEPFFWCPNVQESPCGDNPPPPPPPPPPAQ